MDHTQPKTEKFLKLKNNSNLLLITQHPPTVKEISGVSCAMGFKCGSPCVHDRNTTLKVLLSL